MKNIIAPLALALLSTVAVADDDFKFSHETNQITANILEFRIQQAETLKQMEQSQQELDERMARHWEEQRKNINKPIKRVSKQKANSNCTNISVSIKVN